ncbi:MAG TPA: YihY family inner membrane protein [Xanthomonadaceae bacterium]|nr:YihY family inner membrane protein [Xanthomonadaceae bacterium]
MPLSDFTSRLTQRVDRERTRSFLRFLWKRFLDDNCFLTAGALSYTSMVALVPLTATVLGVIAMFPIYQRWGDALTVFLFRHFVPRAVDSMSGYVRAFAQSARGLTGFGAIGVIATSLFTMASIEDAFNRIWRVPTSRRPHARFLIYCAALLFGPLLAVASLALSSYLFSLPMVVMAEQSVLVRFGWRLLPVALELIAFTAAYAVIPNRSVRFTHALAGGALATALFESAKYAIVFYLSRASYQQIYGAMAAVPIFLLWIWVSWLVVLLGATFAAALSSFRYQPRSMCLPRGFEFYALLRLLGRFAQARTHEGGLHTAQMHALEPILTDDLLQRLLGALSEVGVVERSDRGEWRLARDLDEVGLIELYEAVGLPIPVGEVTLPCHDDALGARAQAALDALRLPLRERMQRSVGSIYPTGPEPSSESPNA